MQCVVKYTMDYGDYMNENVSKLTLKEKALLTNGNGQWRTHAVTGIPTIVMSDGPHGLRKQDDACSINDSVKATCFPTACAVASSWNVDNASKVAHAIADEAIEQNVSLVLGPGVNIKRSPLCGRNFEYFSEDPTLAGHMANAYVGSMQSDGVGCCLKHFAANSQETRRMTVDAIVDERALREIYLAAFEYVVKNSQPYSIMASYNKINGHYSTQNKWLLTDVLRNEWGFEGAVISDWGACYNTPSAIAAGMDLEMPADKEGYHRKTVVNAVQNGTLPVEQLDAACEHVENLVRRCNSVEKHSKTSLEQRQKLCREVAADSAVLLKNNGVLPLSATTDFCVIGELAEKPRYQGAGSSHINSQCKNFLQVLADNGIDASYAKGYPVASDVVNEKLQSEALALAKKHKVVLFFGGLTDNYEGEGYDRTHLAIPTNQQVLLQKLKEAGCNVAFVAFGGAPFEMPWLDGVDALLNMYLGGEAVMQAAYDLLFGAVSPSGRLAETYPLKLQNTPCFNYFANDRYFDQHRESIFVGYRYYDTFNVPVLFPFGYGLSYSQFSYENLMVNKIGDGFSVEVTVKNVGNCKASEVVQLYVDNCSCGRMRPKRELRAFGKVLLDVGEATNVKFNLSGRDFSICEGGKFVAINGKYGISICKNVAETLLTAEVDVDFGINLTADGTKDLCDYFQSTGETFVVCDEQFKRLTGFSRPNVRQAKRGEFTMLNTFEDMNNVGLVRLLVWALKRHAIKGSPTKSANDPVVQMLVNGAKQTPLISMMSVGKVNARYVKFILYHANKKHFKALKALFGKYTID